MGQLHQTLAVESAKEKAAKNLIAESLKTFGKSTLFTGQYRKLTMFNEEDKHSETEEYQELTTTVDENLDYLVKPLSSWFDAVLMKDSANQEARADILIDGLTLVKDVPATFLLGLENKLNQVRVLYLAIPTLPPGIKWELDDQRGEGVYRAAHEEVTMKSIKDSDFRTVAEATKEHPAQVAQIQINRDVGQYAITKWNGMMTPVEKAARISRIDELMNAVKEARMRANKVEVKHQSIGIDLLNFINKGE